MKKLNTNAWRFILITAFLFSVSGNFLFAQQSVTGVITDEETGEGMIGVNVSVKGTTIGCMTDLDGHYSINAETGDIIVFSYIGYVSREIAVTGSTLNVVLSPDMIALEEVVAIGYAVQKKKELTGAVTQVKADEMLKNIGSDFTKTLQGKVAGLSVIESSGRPGDQANVQIRGLGSISSKASPLYVVDGIPAEGNPNIPAEEIEAVDILKDGAAAAVYGTRASNGVILITTKKGEAGETKINFASYYGIQNIVSGTPLLNTEQHLFVDEMVQRSRGGHSSILYYNPNAMDYNTDFIDLITNDNAAIQNYNLTLSGGKEGLTFNINTNYFNQDGILIQSGYERLSTRANAMLTKGKFSAFVSLSLMEATKNQEPWNLYQYALFQGPFRKPIGAVESNITVDGNNPDHVGFLARILTNSDERKENSQNISANLKYEIIEGLAYQINLGYNHWQFVREYWQPKFTVYDEAGDVSILGSRLNAVLEETFMNSRKQTMENTLNYNRTFGQHKLGLLLGYTVEQTNGKTTIAQKQDFISNNVAVFDGGSTLSAIRGNKYEHGIVGKLFRVQYTFADKYMFSASGRYDGSSRMGADNRYAFFPGISAGWNISDEAFMNKYNWLTNLKLRASYGEVGNEGIDNYLYASYVNANIDYIWGPEGSDKLGLGAIQRSYSNPDVAWERNISRNIGIDLNALNGKITATFDWYQNDKKDMLLDVLLPPSSGTNVGYDNNFITTNIGNMVNQGIELSATYKGHTKFGLNWGVSATFTKNTNEITSLGSMKEIPLEDSKLNAWTGGGVDDIITYMKTGYPAGSFFLIPTDGVIKTQEQLDEVKAYMPNAQLGDLKLIDTNGDGTIDDNDRVYQGSGMPDFETNLSLNASYKGFDFSAQLFYSHGNKVYDGAKQFAYSAFRHEDLYGMWTPNNITSDIFNPTSDNCRTRTDFFLSDGSFLRIRNLTLGYTLNKRWFGNVFDHARFYISAQNPFTFTKYDGYDPEVGGNGVSNRGVDKGNYPISRKFLAGIQIEF